MSDTPWHEGVWVVQDKPSYLIVVNGTEYKYKGLVHLDYPDSKSHLQGTLEAGEFGPTPDNIRTASGVEKFNLKMNSEIMERNAVLTSNGKQMYMPSFLPGQVDILEWADDDKLKQLRENRESVHAPSYPSYYTPQPDRIGKLVWFTGPPGAGKSTSAQLMARHHGYIYYEVDAFFSCVNPFIDVNVENPTMATMSQPPLKDIPADIIKIMDEGSETFKNMMKGIFDGLDDVMAALIPPLSDNIKQQRKRLGGDWAIAMAIFSRTQRDIVRKMFDGNVVFMVLNLTQECQAKRLAVRHAGTGFDLENAFTKMFKLYEAAGEDEENAYNVAVTENMTPDDVIKEVQTILQRL